MWGSRVEIERRRRIRVSVWAYAYEFDNTSLVDDATFDRESRLIDPSISTGRAELDAFFRSKFEPDTGMWIQDHPDKAKLKALVAFCKRKPQQLTLI